MDLDIKHIPPYAIETFETATRIFNDPENMCHCGCYSRMFPEGGPIYDIMLDAISLMAEYDLEWTPVEGHPGMAEIKGVAEWASMITQSSS